MSVKIAETTREHVWEVMQPTITEDDLKVLARWLERAQTIWLGESNEEVICAWGLVPPTLLSDTAYLWMITFPEAERHQFVLVRHSQIQIAEMLKRYRMIVGHCEVTAERSMRWLRWLGAEFRTPQNGLCEFFIRRREDG